MCAYTLDEDQVVRANEDIVKHIRRELSFDVLLADDLLQEGRIALVKAARAWDADRGVKFRTFAGTLVRNAMIDFLCRQPSLKLYVHTEAVDAGKCTKGTMAETVKDSAPTPEELLMEKERVEYLKEKVKCLTPTQRAFIARHLEGANGIEIAAENGKLPQAVSASLKRAMRHLREEMRAANDVY